MYNRVGTVVLLIFYGGMVIHYGGVGPVIFWAGRNDTNRVVVCTDDTTFPAGSFGKGGKKEYSWIGWNMLGHTVMFSVVAQPVLILSLM